MKRQARATLVALTLILVWGVASASAQAAFKVPFPLHAGGK
jgi:hypothetical protein